MWGGDCLVDCGTFWRMVGLAGDCWDDEVVMELRFDNEVESLSIFVDGEELSAFFERVGGSEAKPSLHN